MRQKVSAPQQQGHWHKRHEALSFDRNREALTQLAGELEAEKLLITGDITREEDLLQLRDTVYSAQGKVNLLLNNAGVKIAAGASDSPISGESRWRLT